MVFYFMIQCFVLNKMKNDVKIGQDVKSLSFNKERLARCLTTETVPFKLPKSMAL